MAEKEVTITKPVSRAVGLCGLSRPMLIHTLSTLRFELKFHYERYRSNRSAEEPDLFFVFPLRLLDWDTWHAFDFLVNDTTAADRLFVEEVAHRSRPA